MDIEAVERFSTGKVRSTDRASRDAAERRRAFEQNIFNVQNSVASASLLLEAHREWRSVMFVCRLGSGTKRNELDEKTQGVKYSTLASNYTERC